VRLAGHLAADVVLMDIRMPGCDGLTATRRLMAAAPATQVRVLVLTTFDLDQYVYDALKAGASGFLLKDASPEQLTDAIRVVAEGGAMLSPMLTKRLIEDYVSRPPAAADDRALLDRFELTEREAEIWKHLARGLSNAEIGRALYVSEATVKTHVTRVFDKLQVRDRLQAAVMAYEVGAVRVGTNS
jgi:DNA-binding NarL/FixJ family response regulator